MLFFDLAIVMPILSIDPIFQSLISLKMPKSALRGRYNLLLNIQEFIQTFSIVSFNSHFIFVGLIAKLNENMIICYFI